jgi:hypothetical protein
MAASGAEPSCLLDAWVSEMIKARAGQGSDEQRRVLSREYSDHEIAMVVLSFLFASQDAMTSAIVYLFQLMANNPEILAKVREEQYRVRNNDVDAPLSLESVDEMVYTRACVKESLRLLPPVIMVSLEGGGSEERSSSWMWVAQPRCPRPGALPHQEALPDLGGLHCPQGSHDHPVVLELAARRARLPGTGQVHPGALDAVARGRYPVGRPKPAELPRMG